MSEVRATTIAAIVQADATGDGLSIVFQMRDVRGGLHTFGLSADLAKGLTTMLTAVGQRAKRLREDPEPKVNTLRASNAIWARRFALGADAGAVIFSFYPNETLPIDLAMSPADVRKLRDSLTEAIASAEAQQTQKMN